MTEQYVNLPAGYTMNNRQFKNLQSSYLTNQFQLKNSNLVQQQNATNVSYKHTVHDMNNANNKSNAIEQLTSKHIHPQMPIQHNQTQKNINKEEPKQSTLRNARKEMSSGETSSKDEYLNNGTRLDYYQMLNIKDRFKQKNVLANALSQQISQKQLKKLQEKQHSRQMEASFLRHTHQLNVMQSINQKNFKDKMREQLRRENLARIQNKQKQRETKKRIIQTQKNQIEQSEAYLSNEMRKGNHLSSDPIKNYVFKMQETKQKLNAKEKRNRENPQHTVEQRLNREQNNQKESDEREKMNKRSMSLPRLIPSAEDNIYTRKINEERNTKMNLRESLLQQMEEQQSRRMNARNQRRMRGVAEVRGVHHPILNPVDLKFAHDNHLLLKKLTGFQY